MEFSFTNDIDGNMVKSMLGRHGISKRLLAKVKFDGGRISVNGIERNAIYRLRKDDVVTLTVPDEPNNEKLLPEEVPLNILFEDEHYLVVEKPAGKPSITGSLHPVGAMSNAIKGYITQKNYPNQTVHIITRLDRDTSGLMFFAKHRYAHALMVQHRYRDTLEKRYFALVSSEGLPDKGKMDWPIGRRDDSIIQRQVRFDGQAKSALTTFEVADRKNGLALVDVTLHTGRTHQIRVHFSHLGYPLIGDNLYGGNHELIKRQALHCHHLQFLHPFTEQMVQVELELPDDIKNLLSV